MRVSATVKGKQIMIFVESREDPDGEWSAMGKTESRVLAVQVLVAQGVIAEAVAAALLPAGLPGHVCEATRAAEAQPTGAGKGTT